MQENGIGIRGSLIGSGLINQQLSPGQTKSLGC